MVHVDIAAAQENASNTGNNQGSHPKDNDLPNPEVKEQGRRRILTTQWKLDFIRRFDLCNDSTEKGKLLRSESVYLSQVYQWKRVVQAGTLVPGCQRKRGRPRISTTEEKGISKENKRLKRKLQQAEQIIELQKKIAEIFAANDEST